VSYLFKFKTICAAAIGLVLSTAVAHAEPPYPDDAQPDASGLPTSADHSNGKTLTQRSLTAVGQAASRIGEVISTGAQAFGSGVQHVTDQATALIEHAKGALGVPYRWGGTSTQSGFDCSGFVRAMVQETIGKMLPHHAADQAAVTQKISKDELQPGDLVFFDTVRRRAYSHVGIYMGDGQFIHEPAKGERVRIDNLSEAYWQKHFEAARRILSSNSFPDDGTVSAGLPGLVAQQQTADAFAALPNAMATNATAGAIHKNIVNNTSPVNPLADVNVVGASTSNDTPVINTSTPAASTAIPVQPAPDTSSIHPHEPKRYFALRRYRQKHTAVYHRGKFKTGSTKKKKRGDILASVRHRKIRR
jgi:cell wall-associated NlpC family hydrolase